MAASTGLMQKSSPNMKCYKKSVTLHMSKGFLSTQQPDTSPSRIYVENHRYKWYSESRRHNCKLVDTFRIRIVFVTWTTIKLQELKSTSTKLKTINFNFNYCRKQCVDNRIEKLSNKTSLRFQFRKKLLCKQKWDTKTKKFVF